MVHEHGGRLVAVEVVSREITAMRHDECLGGAVHCGADKEGDFDEDPEEDPE